MSQLNKKFLLLEGELNQYFLEREQIIRGLLVATIARGNLLILGPPGTAKTNLAEMLANQLGGKFFSRLLTKVSSPEELFGPLSLKELENDRYKRVTSGRLPEADIAVIDEIFKCNSAVLNTLLPILNERVYFDDSNTASPIPLQLLVGLSNELPEGGAEGELLALWDRFDLRYVVDYLKEEKSFASMLALNEYQPTTNISLKELEKAQSEAAQVKITETTINTLVRLWKELKSQGILISDRRFRNALRFLKAHAWLAGRIEVGEEDLEILTHIFWTQPEQVKQIKKIVLGLANPLTLQANEIYDGALELHYRIKELPEGAERSQAATEANHKLKVAAKMLSALSKQAKQEGKSTTTISQRQNQIKEINEEIVNSYLLGI